MRTTASLVGKSLAPCIFVTIFALDLRNVKVIFIALLLGFASLLLVPGCVRKGDSDRLSSIERIRERGVLHHDNGEASGVDADERCDEYEPGAQIDLVIERDDRVINVCEIKYCSDDEYVLDSEERKKIAGRISSFRKNTGTKYGIVPTLITTYGLKRGINSSYFNGLVVTLSDLLKF